MQLGLLHDVVSGEWDSFHPVVAAVAVVFPNVNNKHNHV